MRWRWTGSTPSAIRMHSPPAATPSARSLFAEAMRRLQQAEIVLSLVAEVRDRLDSRLIGWASGNLDDMRAQLAALTPPGFLRTVPAAALAEYPRYLKALSLRAERALRDPVRDQARMLELKPFTDALADATQQEFDARPEWQALRWDLEELRVSLFAQELGARGGVSAKKLAGGWRSCAAEASEAAFRRSGFSRALSPYRREALIGAAHDQSCG